MVVVNNDAEFATELSAATGGETIELAEGVTFGDWPSLGNFSSEVIVKSVNPTNKTITGRIGQSGNQNLTVQDVHFRYVYNGEIPEYPFIYLGPNTTNFKFQRCKLDCVDQQGAPFIAGYGIRPDGAINLEITDCDISSFGFCIVGRNCTNAKVIGNNVYGMRSDGIHFGDSTTLLIERNWVHDAATPQIGDHVDYIQIQRSIVGSTDVTIRGNVVDQGNNSNTGQAIHCGDKGAATAARMHQRFLIEDNILICGEAQGCHVQWCNDLVIRRNALLLPHPSGFTSPAPNQMNVNPNSDSTNVTITDNIYPTLTWGSFDPSWTVGRNHLLVEGDYTTYFNLLARPVIDNHNDFEIKAGTQLHTDVAGPRTMPREGGWPAGGIEPHVDYPGGFSLGGSPPPTLTNLPAILKFNFMVN